MTFLLRRSLFVSALVATASFAQPWNRSLASASEAVEDAASRAQRASGRCRNQVAPTLRTLADRIDGMRRQPADVAELNQLRLELSAAGQQAPFSACPISVTEDIEQALEALEEARGAMYSDPGRRRDRDRRNQGAPTPFVQMAALQVTPNVPHGGEQAVRFTVPEVRFENLQGQGFYVAARFRSYEGDWSEWVTTQVWTVPSAPFVWRNAYNHLVRYSTLAEDDFSNGRFIARVSVFSAQGQELAFREVNFRVPQLRPVPVPAPVVVQRDCGRGVQDPGCLMSRDGRFAMGQLEYQQLMARLRAERFELRRETMITSAAQSAYFTAAQFGPVLDLISNELTKMSVARAVAPRLVNPQHAQEFASKFRMTLSRRDYAQLIAAQPFGAPWQPGMPVPPELMQQPGVVVQPGIIVQPGVPQPAVIVPVPAPPMPTVIQPAVVMQARDCGTGAGDVGCTMTRNGLVAMDAQIFQGFMSSLQNVANELVREDMFETLIANNALTAQQLGRVLDLFNNELTRLSVAKTAAPRCVNPQHAIGLSTKFNNSFSAQDFIEVYSSQR